MTDPRWRGIERGLVRASELPSPAPATTLFDNSDNPTPKYRHRKPRSKRNQALALLNGPIYYALDAENSLLANRLNKLENEDRIHALFRAILSRNPTSDDIQIASQVWKATIPKSDTNDSLGSSIPVNLCISNKRNLQMLNQFNPLKRRQFLDRLTLATLGVTTSSSLAEKIVGPPPSNKKLIFLTWMEACLISTPLTHIPVPTKPVQ